ncbi:hypothetical protein Tco_1045347 [Tanacetum coccineum]|uniref:30S ribosomal protein S4e n=1 Tax=Tanacetum coccineum TaxID=301880 RepID=A0ABQ5GUP0_9ASTR
MAKLKRSNELKRKRYQPYGWTTTTRLKPKKITDIHIHLNTKPVAVTVYRNNDRRNFEVVGDMMDSLSKKYDKLKVIPSELGLNTTLLAPEQVPSLSSGIKRKALKLEPEVRKVRIAGLECNKSLTKGILFVNNRVIETPKHGIFFIDAFEEQAFQRVSGIHKVIVETLMGYLVVRNTKKCRSLPI